MIRTSDLLTGLTAGLAFGGAWLTARGFFRSDGRIRDEESLQLDGGDKQIALRMEDARVGRLGLLATAISIVLAGKAHPVVHVGHSIIVALGVALLCAMLGWARSLYFWRVERPAEVQVAESMLDAARSNRETAQ